MEAVGRLDLVPTVGPHPTNLILDRLLVPATQDLVVVEHLQGKSVAALRRWAAPLSVEHKTSSVS